MAEERAQRRLAAIRAADVVGYSRLMGLDEAGTLAALKKLRKEVLGQLVAQYQGRVFKVTGDGVLLEFSSAVNAVACAVELQKRMAAANESVPKDRHIILRIGVNLGDVVVEGGDLYGDGVIVAARLEGIAESGTVLVSGAAYDQVKNKASLSFDDLGVQTLKNISEPVRVYRVDGLPTVTVSAPTLIVAKPSIAVLPFTNMSGDPDQEYFSDGLTEDIIVELSRFRTLLVIARNSSFVFKGQAVDVKDIGRRLGVQYVVEGSVRKRGGRIRITAQLIDAASGNHLWSERYDRVQEDIFAIQDEVRHSIVVRLEGRLSSSMAEQTRRKPTELLAAYDLVLQARQHLSIYNAEAAKPLLRRAIDLDPNYAQAYLCLAWAILIDYFSEPKPELLDESLQLAQRAVTLDPNDAWCHGMLGNVRTFRREFDEAGASLERGLALNPSDRSAVVDHAYWLCRVGRHEESLLRLDFALQRDPFPKSVYWEVRSGSLFALGRFDESIQSLKRQDQLSWWSWASLSANYAMLGRTDEARTAVAEVLRVRPNFTIRDYMITEPFNSFADAELLREGLRKAGLPE